MSAESDALRDALLATDPTEDQKRLREAYERAENARRQAERDAEWDAKKKQEAQEEADREAAAEAEAEALQAAQDEADAKAERDAEIAAQREKEIEDYERQQQQNATSGWDHAAIARAADQWRLENAEARVAIERRAIITERWREEDREKHREEAEAEAALRERQERQAADAERLGVDWDPDATGRKLDKQVVALSNARFDEAVARRDAEFAQRRTIQRLAGQLDVEPAANGAQEAQRTTTLPAAQRLIPSPEDQIRAQRAAREAEIAAATAARARAVGIDWNEMPATAREAAQQRRALDERERMLGIAPQGRDQEHSTGIEL